VYVHEERATGDNVLLALAARQQLPLRLLRHSPHGGHSRRAGEDTTDSSYSRRPRLSQRKGIWSFPLHHTDANRLKLKLTHRADLSDTSSVNPRQSRKLRS